MAPVNEYVYLREAHRFGSHYDQADGQDVEYPAGTRVQVIAVTTPPYVWIKAPNGREACVSRDLLAYGPGADAA